MVISDRFKTILFHLFLWSSWMYLSLSNAHDDELYSKTILLATLITLTHIPLFLLNTEWLIPKILHQKGVTIYFWSLLGVVTIFYLYHNFVLDVVRGYLEPGQQHGKKTITGLVAILLVAAISTGYGLLKYLTAQEKIYQEKQQERLQSELSFLRSQISPHFIFNILNSIVYLIRSKSPLAEAVTMELSELMRYMLYESEKEQISLEKEVFYLKNYIALQEVRFGEDVNIRFQTEGTPTTQIIEPMILIPFVENAFKHGVGMVQDPMVQVSVKILEKNLHFSVSNKIAPEITEDKDNSSGIGLRNVRRRLELLYPKAHQLDIKQENGWFVVDLNLTLTNIVA